MKKIPVLIVIPHGGYRVPEELAEFAAVEDSDILLSADTCANDLFCADDLCAAVLNTHISRLFVDVDRAPLDIPPKTPDGVIKTETVFGREIFPEGVFPDEIALTGLLKRYYFPFHSTLKKIRTSGDIQLILECHTVHAVGPKHAYDKNRPRPVISLQNTIEKDGKIIETAPLETVQEILAAFKKSLSGEEAADSGSFRISDIPSQGYLMQKHSGTIPYVRLNLSRGLFLNESYFNYDYGKIDQIRIDELRKKIKTAITRFGGKVF